MTKNSFINRIKNGFTPEDYLYYFWQELEAGRSDYLDYMKLNWQRTKRIEKTYEVSKELRMAIEEITQPQLWLIITELWCGDSAQCLPYIVKVAAYNEKITVKIILRDQNLEIMDQYLTSGKRAIPKLIAFDENENELFVWGPRPKEAAAIFKQEKAKGLKKEEIYKKIHLFY